MDAISRTFGTVIVLAALLAGCAAPAVAPMPAPTLTPVAAAPSAPAYWPTNGWRTTTPEEQGMDSEKLADMLEHIQAENLNLHSLLIVRHGYLVGEIYAQPYTAGQAHWVASTTKSVVSALVGIAIQQGKIKDVKQSLWSLLPADGVKNLDENKQKITLEDLLTMTSGLDCNDDPSSGQPIMETSANWVGFMLDLPMAAAPGTHYTYCSGVTHLLSAVLQHATGMTTREYANQVLFPRIGIDPIPENRWTSDPQGVTIGGYELYLTPREMAKFGYLYLHQGSWDGQQVVPAAWVAASTAWHVDKGDGLGYGYQWHIDPGRKNYAALGRAGQHIFVYPEQDLVVVFTSGLPYRSNQDFAPLVKLLNDYILPAAAGPAGPLPANSSAAARFQAGVQALAQPRKDLPPLPTTAAQISGKTFTLETNDFGWSSLALAFSPGQAEAAATLNGAQTLAIGLDNLYRQRDTGEPLFPEGVRGWWQDASTFVVDDVWIGRMVQYRYTLHYTSGTTIQITRLETYTGQETTVNGKLSSS
jgi:CubicO group peptidase (beta-lactamase class C family)